MTNPIPDGFSTVTPHLVVSGGAKAIEFYERAFGAVEVFRNSVEGTDTIMHARIKIGDSLIMLNDEFPEHGVLAPAAGSTPPVTIHIYTEDVDASFQRAVDAGATAIMPPADMFWGDRYAMLACPFGHRWSIATCTEELTPEQIREKAKEAFA